MMQWILSSSLLILIVTALRHFLKGKISLRIRYGLWLLVLLRLLIPVNLGGSVLSIQNLVEGTPAAEALAKISRIPIPTQSYDRAYAQAAAEYERQGIDISSLQGSALEQLEYDAYDLMTGPTVGEVAKTAFRWFWILSAAFAGFCFLWKNLRYARLLRSHRRKVVIPDVPIPVYVSDAVATPCLFGLLHPAVYLTEEVFGDPRVLRHVLSHEITHCRHRDPVWAALRCLCLAVHWFNPLVWLAAKLSLQDCELACDEGSIRRLGEDARTDYGKALISLTCSKRNVAALYVTATTMVGSKKSIRERIERIARQSKTSVCSLILMILIAVVAVGCTFTGSITDAPDPELPTEENVTPTGYPSGQMQIQLIYVNGQLYAWDSNASVRPTEPGSRWILVGSILQEDNSQEPCQELTACRVPEGSEVYTDPDDALHIYFRLPDDTVYFPMIRADQVENWWSS